MKTTRTRGTKFKMRTDKIERILILICNDMNLDSLTKNKSHTFQKRQMWACPVIFFFFSFRDSKISTARLTLSPAICFLLANNGFPQWRFSKEIVYLAQNRKNLIVGDRGDESDFIMIVLFWSYADNSCDRK